MARPGARYACAGDGLCCTDIHVLGPLTRSDLLQLRRHRAIQGVTANEQLEAVVLRTVPGGGCTFLGPQGCTLHATHGPQSKPGICRRFPYRLVATPLGGRVLTEHRCPCRTLGERPPLSLADAEHSLRGSLGKLDADARVSGRIALSRRRHVSFSTYVSLEGAMLARLDAGDDPAKVLDAEAFPALETATWQDVAHHFRSRLDGTACNVALAWFGDVLLAREGTRLRRLRERPWSLAFDRAEARSPAVRPPAEVLADWVADALFGLEWVERGPFDAARAEIATRLEVALHIAGLLEREGTRVDRAAAEAVTIVELAGAAPVWRSVVAAMTFG